MKALVYTAPETLEYQDAQDPSVASDEHLVRIEAVGICGSDMHAYLGHDKRRPAPFIFGHEGAGTVVGGPRDGERVTINPLVECGKCWACVAGRENLCPKREIISMPPRQGAFAQYVSMTGKNLITVPDGFSIDQASLAEPLAVSWHSARLAMGALSDETRINALVLGGGAIGLGAALALRAMGVDQITIFEPNARRSEYLSSIGEDAVNVLPGGEFVLVVDAVGLAATRATASEIVRPGGLIIHIGLAEHTGGLDVRRMTLQEISFIATYTYTAKDFRDTAAAMFDGRLGPLEWIQRRPLSAGAQAFADIHDGRVKEPKIVLTPWE